MSQHARILEDQIELNHAIIMASEKWAKNYKDAPKQHAKLIRTQAKMLKVMRKYFRDMSKRVSKDIKWSSYKPAVQAADKVKLTVTINDDVFFDASDAELEDMLYDPMLAAAYLGASAGEAVYSVPVGLNPGSEALQRAARGRIAELVGKKVNKDGTVVDNPSAKMNINDTTREGIENAIRTSQNLGETREEAIARVQEYIDDPARAESIANTESVNAYQLGQKTYANESGAVAKEWLSVNDEDECGDNADDGVIAIDDTFSSGDDEPTAHPNCLCNLRYVYPDDPDAADFLSDDGSDDSS